jgi:allantoinase
MVDVIIRGGAVVTADGVHSADVAIEDGVIRAIGSELGEAREEIDAHGLVVLPGMMDVHVHFNEPGRTGWEGAASGSRALAAGGGTAFFDMPLNSTPCTVTARDVELKRRALAASSIADFAIWGGLTPGSLTSMAEMAAQGVIGFKAFMCDSGLPEFPRADDRTLLDGMREAARLHLPVAVHAESQDAIATVAAQMRGRVPGAPANVQPFHHSIRDFLASRPVVAELEAIERALSIAEQTGVQLHIVHVSSGRGIAVAAAARARGVDVSIETCPHYLFFTEADLEQLGATAKCAPPLRSAGEQAALWRELLDGHVDIVASDHSPAEPALKRGEFGAAWGGIAGVQSTLAVLVDRGHHEHGLTLERIAALVAATPARRFRVPGKGRLAEGFDADITLVRVNDSFRLDAVDLRQRHRMSPYVGASFRGRVTRTIRRGETIFADGRITATTNGRFLRPVSPS